MFSGLDRGGFELSPLMPGTQSEIDILFVTNFLSEDDAS